MPVAETYRPRRAKTTLATAESRWPCSRSKYPSGVSPGKNPPSRLRRGRDSTQQPAVAGQHGGENQRGASPAPRFPIPSTISEPERDSGDEVAAHARIRGQSLQMAEIINPLLVGGVPELEVA